MESSEKRDREKRKIKEKREKKKKNKKRPLLESDFSLMFFFKFDCCVVVNL